MTDYQYDQIMAVLAEIKAALSTRPAPAQSSGRPADGCYRFGRRKGERLTGSPLADLEWYEAAIMGSIGDPAKAKYRADNEAHLAEVQAALGRVSAPVSAQPTVDDDIPF